MPASLRVGLDGSGDDSGDDSGKDRNAPGTGQRPAVAACRSDWEAQSGRPGADAPRPDRWSYLKVTAGNT